MVKAPTLSVHRNPDSSSERVTQVLYNERLKILEQKGSWSKVLVPDQYRTRGGYPGWVKADAIRKVGSFTYDGGSWVMISVPSTKIYDRLKADSPHITVFFGTYLRYLGYVKDKRTYPSGDAIYWLKCRSADGKICWALNDHARISRGSPFQLEESGRSLINTASVFMGAPYLWGGMTIQGIDCSGLTYMVYRYHGYFIPRDADQQFLAGDPVNTGELQPGDLLFYGSGRSASHVAIYAGSGLMIESGRSNGVVMREVEYGPRFIGACRIFEK